MTVAMIEVNQPDHSSATTSSSPKARGLSLLVDGSNVCYWHIPAGAEGTPSLSPLLLLLSELGRAGSGFLCFFDANLRHRLPDSERRIYQDLLNSHPTRFGEVPGRTQSDDIILSRADARGSRIVSNDLFRQYRMQFRWLSDDSRLIKGRVIGDSLQVTSLGILVAYEPDVNRNLTSFTAHFPRVQKAVPNHTTRRAHAPQTQPIRGQGVKEFDAIAWAEGRPLIRTSAVVIALLMIVLSVFGIGYRGEISRLVDSIRYGSRVKTAPLRERAQTALRKVSAYDASHGIGAKIVDARAAVRDAELLFTSGQYRKSEVLYRQALLVSDELMKFETERLAVRKLKATMETRRRDAIRAGARTLVADLWQQAEETRRTAEASFLNGDFSQARQRYEQAKNSFEDSAARAVQPPPTPEPTATPSDEPSSNPSPIRFDSSEPSLVQTRKRIVKEGDIHQNVEQ